MYISPCSGFFETKREPVCVLNLGTIPRSFHSVAPMNRGKTNAIVARRLCLVYSLWNLEKDDL